MYLYDTVPEWMFQDTPETPTCPQCGGQGNFLGTLGTRDHFRCRQCGWEFSVPREHAGDAP